jgi:hypothetical protein
MQSLKFKIKNCDNLPFIQEKQETYSFAFREGYSKISQLGKAGVVKLAKEKYGLNDNEADSLVSSVSSKFNQTKTSKEKAEGRILVLTNKIEELDKNKTKTKKERRSAHKLKSKLKIISANLSKDIVFGGKYNLKKISYLSNFRGQEIELKNGKKINVNESLQKYLTEYKNKRILPMFLVGESNQKGNRFFNFDLKNNKVTYKPNRKTKINIEFYQYKHYASLLCKLQDLIKGKHIPITVQLSTEYIIFSFDECIVSGYCIDERARKAECEQAKKLELDKDEEVKLIKTIYKKYYNILEEKKLSDKLPYRYFAVDLNPNAIGCSVLDRDDTKKEGYKIVTTFSYDLTVLNTNPPKNATAEERKRFTNKRKHGITHIWKDIFNALTYYKCGSFAVEELSFSLEEEKNKAKEANRQTHNMWHRELTAQLINKYCNTRGIIKEEVSSVYTSTIGNLLHKYVDCINSSIEIGRRAIFRFEGGFYPRIPNTVFHAMSKLNNVQPRDVGTAEVCDSWSKVHVTLKESGLRYRRSLSDLRLRDKARTFVLSSKLGHSNIKKVIFV